MLLQDPCYLEVCLHTETHLFLGLAYGSLRIARHTLLKEVVLPLKRNPLHEVKRIPHIVDLRVSELNHQTICHELNILRHQDCVHPNQLTRQGLDNEILLNLHGLLDDLVDLGLLETVLDFSIEETGEIRVHPLIASNELIAGC